MSARSLLVLGWHNVGPTWGFPAVPDAGVRGFARQVRALKRTHNVVPLEAAAADLLAGRPLPPRALALTFDDGYRDNLTVAADILDHHRLPATFFLVPHFLSRTADAWWETLGRAFALTGARRLSWGGRDHQVPRERADRYTLLGSLVEPLKQLDFAGREAAVRDLSDRLEVPPDPHLSDLFLDWDEARRLAQRFAIGSHSLRHAILSRETPSEQERDLARARQVLQERLEVPVNLLAYPNGREEDVSTDSVRAAELAGHQAAVTTVPAWSVAGTPPLRLRRFVTEPQTSLRLLPVLLRLGSRPETVG